MDVFGEGDVDSGVFKARRCVPTSLTGPSLPIFRTRSFAEGNGTFFFVSTLFRGDLLWPLGMLRVEFRVLVTEVLGEGDTGSGGFVAGRFLTKSSTSTPPTGETNTFFFGSTLARGDTRAFSGAFRTIAPLVLVKALEGDGAGVVGTTPASARVRAGEGPFVTFGTRFVAGFVAGADAGRRTGSWAFVTADTVGFVLGSTVALVFFWMARTLATI
jgi:hypothetical protein